MTAALDQALDMVKRFEGCRLHAYQDIVGVWTIGYGETLGVVAGMEWTREQAEEALRRRLSFFMLRVVKICPVLQLEPASRLAACTSLAYNIGLGAFKASSVRSHAMRKEWPQAAAAFLRWNKAGGKVIRGLTLRREIESKRFMES